MRDGFARCLLLKRPTITPSKKENLGKDFLVFSLLQEQFNLPGYYGDAQISWTRSEEHSAPAAGKFLFMGIVGLANLLWHRLPHLNVNPPGGIQLCYRVRRGAVVLASSKI